MLIESLVWPGVSKNLTFNPSKSISSPLETRIDTHLAGALFSMMSSACVDSFNAAAPDIWSAWV